MGKADSPQGQGEVKHGGLVAAGVGRCQSLNGRYGSKGTWRPVGRERPLSRFRSEKQMVSFRPAPAVHTHCALARTGMDELSGRAHIVDTNKGR